MWKLTRKTKNSKQNQESGNNSTNLQGQSVVVNQGISYSDAKEIAIDVFKSNFLELSKQASETAVARAEELVDSFVEKLEERSPESVESVKTPGLQYALFNAQKEYARTGDKDLSEVLVDILVDRAGEKERNLMQIVLDESITVVPKLTISQMDTLSLIFLLKYSQNYSVVDDASLKRYISDYIKPFIGNLSKEVSLFQHLEFSGCGSISMGALKIQDKFKTTYKGLFLKGFTNEEFEKSFDDFENYKKLVIPCLNDKAKFQIAARSGEHLEEILKQNNISDQQKINKIKSLFGKNLMNDKEILEKLNTCCPYLADFIDIWNDSSMKNMTLTSVGIAVAHANIRRRTNVSIDLGIWIK
jgi:hypothetical protein